MPLRRRLPVLSAHLSATAIAGRILRGGAWTVAGTGGGRILNLLAMILVARALGREEFGALGLVLSVLGMLGMLAGAGLGATATRFVAECRGRDPDRAGRIVGLVRGAGALSAAAVLLLLVLGAEGIAAALLGAGDLAPAIAAGGVLVALQVLRGVQDGVFAGLERFGAMALLRLAEGAAALAAAPLLARGLGLEGALLGLAGATALALLAGWLRLRILLARQGIRPRFRLAAEEWRLLGGFSAPNLMAGLVFAPAISAAMVLLGRTEGGMAELGLYNAAYQWFGPLVFVPVALAGVALPVLVQEWTNGRVATFRRVLLAGTGFGILFCSAASLALAASGEQVMALYGRDFAGGGAVLALVLAAAPFNVGASLAISALQGMNRAWLVFRLNVAWGLVLLAGAAASVADHGAAGLAAAFLAAHAVRAAAGLGLVLHLSRLPGGGAEDALPPGTRGAFGE